MAATYNKRETTSAGTFQKMLKRIEFKLNPGDTTVYPATGIAQNETVALFDFPAGSIILGAQLKVTTAQATVTDVDLGVSTDGSTDASLLDGVSFASAAFVGVTLAAPVYCNVTNQLVFTNKDAQALLAGRATIVVFYLDATPLGA